MAKIVDIESLDKHKELPEEDVFKDLREQIASIKRSVKSENSDYLSGYLCALSAVEGMIDRS